MGQLLQVALLQLLLLQVVPLGWLPLPLGLPLSQCHWRKLGLVPWLQVVPWAWPVGSIHQLWPRRLLQRSHRYHVASRIDYIIAYHTADHRPHHTHHQHQHTA